MSFDLPSTGDRKLDDVLARNGYIPVEVWMDATPVQTKRLSKWMLFKAWPLVREWAVSVVVGAPYDNAFMNKAAERADKTLDFVDGFFDAIKRYRRSEDGKKLLTLLATMYDKEISTITDGEFVDGMRFAFPSFDNAYSTAVTAIAGLLLVKNGGEKAYNYENAVAAARLGEKENNDD